MKNLKDFEFEKIKINTIHGGKQGDRTIGIIIGPNGEQIIVEQGTNDNDSQ
ncbi:hypothetical protein [Aquimarina sediminis]|uniref:hypothetical protein n=1 Tax=Aquimarina sediminis TaxID=2070536 RepID=UPI0013E8D502|nr:hypothetical protein [Aquimarina sediminis]